MLLADLRPGDGQVDFLSGLQRGEAVLEILGSLDHGSVLLDINENGSQPPTLGYEEDLLARTKLIELTAKLASQVIRRNHTGNCHIKPIVNPNVNPRVAAEKGAFRPARSHAEQEFWPRSRTRAYDAQPMVGAALGRLWDTHPKMALVLHLLMTVWLGALAVWLFVTGATGIGVVLTIGFAVMAGSMVLFAWLAAQNNWQSEGSSDDGRGQVVSPRLAWTNTRARARILWVLFGFAFLSALVLLVGRSFAGVAMILVAFVLAIIAMRMD